MQLRKIILLGAATGALMSGCALRDPPASEDVRAQALPGLVTPEGWRAPGAVSGQLDAHWLATFNDAALDALVDEALAHNPDLQASAARVQQAAAYVESASASLFPQLNALGNSSGKSTGGGALNYGGLFASWELDVWGRVRAGREAAQLQLLSAELANQYARQSLAAMVARAWFLASEARLQKGVADEMVKSSDALVRLNQDRARVGVGDDYDIAVARASLASYRDVAEQMDLAWRQAVQAIETLVGRYPAAELEVPARLPRLPGPVPAGLPSELLERRPDVVAAERRVAAAFYRVEEAKAARLPTLALNASGSTLSSDLLLLKERDDWVWGYGGRIVAPLYLGGSLKAQIKLRTAEQEEAVADYGRAGSAAFADVEKTLAAASTLQAREPLLAEAVTEGERALAVARKRYEVGADDLRSVEQQQLQLAAARTSLLRVQSEQLVQRVNLHVALGGDY
jgi:NodT family efflux transporter outer membrane factor (OMF) lipoprotein